uniref:DUF4477 domain-containing protein n=1 Tax=Anopheles dirus TaxID=7168 RepID=A0A182N5B3_9DIPT
MALWNRRNLEPPVILNAPCKSKHIKEQLSAIATTTGNMLQYYSTLSKFERSAAFMSRFCNKWKNRLRNMHGFQIMRRLNQTLIRIKGMDLVSIIVEFHNFMPNANFIEREVNLPVRSNLEYLLVRLQGLAKLLMRVVYLTKEAARYHLKQLANGFLYHQYSIFLALSGEVWLFARGVCRRTEQFYKKLYTALPILPVTKANWLPEGYDLPSSLAAWLGEEYERDILHCAPDTDVFSLDGDSNIFSLLKTGSIDKEETLLARVENTHTPDRKTLVTSFSSVPTKMLLESLRSDTGELVERAPVVSNFDVSQLNHIKSKFHVQQFLTQERKQRTNNPDGAITNGITEGEFGKLNVRLMKEFKRMTSLEFVLFFKEQLTALFQQG